jgi:hypothetical protein
MLVVDWPLMALDSVALLMDLAGLVIDWVILLVDWAVLLIGHGLVMFDCAVLMAEMLAGLLAELLAGRAVLVVYLCQMMAHSCWSSGQRSELRLPLEWSEWRFRPRVKLPQ